VAKPLRLDDPWESMTWEGAAKAHLSAGANLSLPEKLAWLEEINELARNLDDSRRRSGAGGGTRRAPTTERSAGQAQSPFEVETDSDD
jgi:hypothetical protein